MTWNSFDKKKQINAKINRLNKTIKLLNKKIKIETDEKKLRNMVIDRLECLWDLELYYNNEWTTELFFNNNAR